jgi:hypothetical protein
MDMIALPRATYSNLVERQRRADVAIAKLQEAVEALGYDELKPNVARRIEKQSRLLDAGKGIKLKNMRELRAYFRAL